MPTQRWTAQFDAQLKELFGIDLKDAGLNDDDLRLYASQSPRDAAVEFGEDHDLDRVDRGWGG